MGKNGGKKKETKERTKSLKKPVQIWTSYKVAGEKVERAIKSCPKCGPGVNMASHKNRDTCGKCGYTEFRK